MGVDGDQTIGLKRRHALNAFRHLFAANAELIKLYVAKSESFPVLVILFCLPVVILQPEALRIQRVLESSLA